MKVARRLAALLVVGSAMVGAQVACIEPDVQFCSASVICPVTMVCAGDACVTPEQATACEGKVDGDPCTADGIAGTCFGTRCLPAGCGNGRLDQGEACDDGNTTFGDQCAADCQSTEACGNGVVDMPVGEQCDTGPTGLSGDGCSSRCQVELLLWRDGAPPLPARRTGFRVAWNGTALMLVGGSPVGSAVVLDDQWHREGVTWVKHAPATPLPARNRFGMAFDEKREEVVVFGGFGPGGSALQDTWVYANGTWTQVTTETAPSARGDVRLSYDPGLEKIVLFGGALSAGSSSNTLSDTWLWDGQRWTQSGSGSASDCLADDAGVAPCARANAALAYLGTEQRTLMFAGRFSPSGAGPFNRVWQLDPGGGTTAPTWTGQDAPLALVAPTMVAAPVGDGVVAITSSGACTLRTGLAWSGCPAPPGDAAGLELARDPAADSTSIVDSRALVYPFSETQGPWVSAPLVPVAPQAVAFDPLRNVLVVTSDDARTRGTWQWTGRSWHPSGAVPGNVSRVDGAFVFDRDRRELLYFGGVAGGTIYSDLYVFDGQAYVPRAAAEPPPARRDHGLAYDEARRELVLFGGDTSASGAGTNIGDTWTLVGDSWVERAPAAAPSPRAGHSMAYDPAHGNVVLFGGRASGGVSGETWLWDGTTWTNVPLDPSGPRGRERAALIYDPVVQALFLIGGFSPDGWLTDVWRWTGTRWEAAPAVTEPTALVGLVGARDPRGGLAVIGSNAQWRLDRAAAGVPAERCEDRAADLDGDGFAGCADPDCWQRCNPLCPPGQESGCDGPRCGDGMCSVIEVGFCGDCD